MSNILERRASLGAVLPSSYNLSSAQIEQDQLLQTFVQGASDWCSLTSMTLGGFAYRATKLGVMSLGVRQSVPLLVKLSAPILGLTSEVSVFRGMNQILSPHTSPLTHHVSWSTDFVNFASLKFFGNISQNQNLILSHALQDVGMVAGHHLAYRLDLAGRPEGTIVQQLTHAEIMTMQMQSGMALLHRISGGKILSLERIFEHQSHFFNSEQSRVLLPQLFSRKQGISVFSSHNPYVAVYKEHQRRLLLGEVERNFHYVSGDLKIVLKEEELGHVARWVQAGRNLSVSVIIRDAQGRILISYDRKSNNGKGRIPSGGAELLDTNLEEVALREMQEELGTSIELIRKVAWYKSVMYYKNVPISPWNTVIFEARLKGEISLPSEGELKGIEWVSPDVPFHFSMEGFFPQFDHQANFLLRSYFKRYPTHHADIPWSDSETIDSLMRPERDLQVERARNIEYGAHRIQANSQSQSVYSLRDGRVFRFYLNSADVEKIETPEARCIDTFELESPRNEEVQRHVFYGQNKPTISQILREYRIDDTNIETKQDEIILDMGEYTNAYYRKYRNGMNLNLREVRWNWREGVLYYQDYRRNSFERDELVWVKQDGFRFRYQVDEFLGAQLRRENQRSFLEMRDEGVDISTQDLFDFVRLRYPGARLVQLQNAGEEAETYRLVNERGENIFIAKLFNRSSVVETPEMLAKDQILAMWRGEKALRRANIHSLRFAHINAVGPGWMIREFIPADNLGITIGDVESVSQLSRRLSENPISQTFDLRFVSKSLETSLSSTNLGHNLAREMLPDGSIRYIIYDPI